MTISTTVNRFQYSGNGVTVNFAYSSRFLSNSDLVVSLVDNATLVSTPLVLNTDYSVTGAGAANGGTITTNVAPANGKTITIYGNPPLTQLTDWVENDADSAEVKETAFDKLTLICARLNDLIARSLKLSDSDISNSSVTLPTPVPNNLIGWNAAGNALVNFAGTANVLINSFWNTILGTTTASAARSSLGAVGYSDLQNQTFTAFTTGGILTAFTLTPTPALTAYAAEQAFFIAMSVAPGDSPTLNVSGLGAKNWKYYDSTGTKQFITAAVAPIGWQSWAYYDGTDWVMVNPLRANQVVQGTSVPATSGTSISFTGLPSGVKQIIMSLSGVSLSGTSDLRIRIGPVGGVETSGYLGAATGINTTVSVSIISAGFDISSGSLAAALTGGSIILTLIDSATNTWAAQAQFAHSNSARIAIVSGSKALAGALSVIAISSLNGTDTFDAGIVNIQYTT